MSKKTVLTKEGFKNLEKELEILKTKKRKEISKRIKEALVFGDLSENSEYDEAKNDQAIVETRILELEALLKNAEVVDENELSTEYVYVGCKVEIEDLDNKTKIEYKIVGSNESDPAKMKISDESPIGAALINKKNNEILKINVPNGVKNYKILRIFK